MEGSHILQCLDANKEQVVCLVRSRVYLHDDLERNLFAMVVTFTPLPQMSKYLVPQRHRPIHTLSHHAPNMHHKDNHQVMQQIPPPPPGHQQHPHRMGSNFFANVVTPPMVVEPLSASDPMQALAFQAQPCGIRGDLSLH